MARIVLTYIVPFLLPTLIYLGWAYYRTAYAARHGGEAPRLEKGPWALLIFLGALCAVASVVGYGLTQGADANSTYTPPRYEDGRVIPGRMEPRQAP
jgi:purine-cytosine permease-like protein